MLTNNLTRIFDILGILTSVVFIWMTVFSSKSLIGSFFKRYYRLMIIAVSVFGLSFLIEAFGELFGMSVDVADIVHHALIIASGVMLVYAGIVLPKEASEYIQSKQ